MPDVPPFLWADAGTFRSPHAYIVPGAGEVQPYTATATYVNNSGAAITPALRIKSSNGNLLALVFPPTTIANGASAEVTFVPPFGSAAISSGFGPDADLFWPAADPANATIDTTTYPNQFSGSGHYTTLVFAGDDAAFAMAIQGDAFPRLVIGSNMGGVGSIINGIMLGDGTVEPTSSGVGLGVQAGGGNSLDLTADGNTLLNSGTDGNSGFMTLNVFNGLRFERCQGSGNRNITHYGGHGVPTIGGNIGDKYWRDDGAAGTYLYNCTVAGVGGAATWVAIL